MTVALFFDVHVHRAIGTALRLRGVDLVTAQEDGSDRLPDDELLNRATALGRVLVTYDSDFLTEAARRQTHGVPFAGVVFAHLHRVTIRSCAEDLALIAEVMDPAEMANRVEFLPL